MFPQKQPDHSVRRVTSANSDGARVAAAAFNLVRMRKLLDS